MSRNDVSIRGDKIFVMLKVSRRIVVMFTLGARELKNCEG